MKLNPNVQEIMLQDTAALSGDLDFSKARDVLLERVDLSGVTSIKIDPNIISEPIIPDIANLYHREYVRPIHTYPGSHLNFFNNGTDIGLNYAKLS